MKNRPIRTCLGCGRKFAQSDLVRFSLGPNNIMVLDCDVKIQGRGAYCCRKIDCLQAFLKSKKRLARAFRSVIIDGVTVNPLEIEKLLGSGSFR